MDEIILFLGRLHPLVVHAPVGILLLLAVIETAGFFSSPARPAAPVRTWILGVAAVAAAASAALGLILEREGGYDGVLLDRHRWLGLATAALAGVLVLVRNRPRLYAGTLVAAVAAMLGAGHYGGVLTHGSNHLAEHAPGVLKAILGGGAVPEKTAAAARPALRDPRQARAFADVIQPIFEVRCTSCHGDTKTKGDLRLDSWEQIARGGKSGPVFIAGAPGRSRMFQRLTLPPDHKEHMPPEGKPQPDERELALIEWWLAAGAPVAATVAELAPSAEIVAIIADRLGVAAPTGPDRAVILAAAARLEGAHGFQIRPLAPDEPWIEVNGRLAGRLIGDAAVAALAEVAPAIRILDLGETAITDAALAPVAAMSGLRRLALDRTAITDAGLGRLAGLAGLESLNLHSTAVGDAGLEHLKSLPRLRRLYLWQTRTTDSGVRALREALAEPWKLDRYRSEIAALERRIARETVVIDRGQSPAVAPGAPGAPGGR